MNGSGRRARLLEEQTLDQLNCFCRQLAVSPVLAGPPNEPSQAIGTILSKPSLHGSQSHAGCLCRYWKRDASLRMGPKYAKASHRLLTLRFSEFCQHRLFVFQVHSCTS